MVPQNNPLSFPIFCMSEPKSSAEIFWIIHISDFVILLYLSKPLQYILASWNIITTPVDLIWLYMLACIWGWITGKTSKIMSMKFYHLTEIRELICQNCPPNKMPYCKHIHSINTNQHHEQIRHMITVINILSTNAKYPPPTFIADIHGTIKLLI